MGGGFARRGSGGGAEMNMEGDEKEKAARI